MKERDIIINIDKCRDNTMEEVMSPDVEDELDDVEKSVNLSRNVGAISPDSAGKKEKRVSVSAKKSPKPPRPPRGLSLDAADQKLIKEISDLLMIKRARIERLKALRKNKAAAAKASTSSSSNFIAMFFTVFFCVVIIFQGCHSSGIWHGISTSRKPDNIVVQDQPKLSRSSVHMLPEVGSPNLTGMVPRSDEDKATHRRRYLW